MLIVETRSGHSIDQLSALNKSSLTKFLWQKIVKMRKQAADC
jgi:hypothetical protein